METRKFLCARCGRFHEEKNVMDFLGNLYHRINIYFGYSSPFDEETLEFHICELCLFEILRSFKHRPLIDGDDIVTAFDKFRRKEGPYYEDYFIKMYHRLEQLPIK